MSELKTDNLIVKAKLKALPEFIHKKYNISSLVLAGMIMQIITKKVFLFNKLPKTIFEITLYTIAIPINLILRIQSYR